MTPYYERDGITIYHGHMCDVLSGLPSTSIDLVLTDPPYPVQFQHLYGVLGEQSSRLLIDGRSLVTFCGHYQVPDVLDLIRPHLRYWWIGGMQQSAKVRLPGKWVCASWKPALWFVKKSRRGTDCPVDMLPGQAKDKRYHVWGQPSHWFSHWIAALTLPGETVLEPFIGGGATLEAAKNLGRNVIGCEIDEASCEITARRLDQEMLRFGGEQFAAPEDVALPLDGDAA